MKLALTIAAVEPAIGGVMVFGDRGTGKSTAARALAALLPPMKVVEDCRYGCAPEDRGSCPGECAAPRAALRPAGKVTELWVDRSDHLVRYLDVATNGGGRALAPFAMAKIARGAVVVDAINAADFAGAPLPAAAGEITRYEEERIVGYFGGGYLYANAARQEPWL